MAVELSEEQKKLIKSITESEGIVDYVYETYSGSSKGEGYMSKMTRVSITDRKIGKNVLNVVLKSAETDEYFRNHAPVRKMFESEIYMYEKVFSEFLKLLKENNVSKSLLRVPKYYGSCNLELQECLILENLRDLGYTLCNSNVPIDSNHAKLVFAEYGKFHALSLALKHLQPDKFNEFFNAINSSNSKSLNKELMLTTIKPCFEQGLEAIKNNTKVFNALKKYFEEGADNFMLNTLQENDEYTVILHADCWYNNMMFKYEDSENPNKPTKMCLLDFQLAEIGSPVMDLSYYFYVCCTKDLLYEYKNYLIIYHNSLSETLKNLGCDPDKLFPFEALEDHWKKFSKVGLHYALMFIKSMLSDLEEIPDIVEAVKSGKNLLEAFNFESSNTEKYKERINNLVTFMMVHNFL